MWLDLFEDDRGGGRPVPRILLDKVWLLGETTGAEPAKITFQPSGPRSAVVDTGASMLVVDARSFAKLLGVTHKELATTSSVLLRENPRREHAKRTPEFLRMELKSSRGDVRLDDVRLADGKLSPIIFVEDGALGVACDDGSSRVLRPVPVGFILASPRGRDVRHGPVLLGWPFVKQFARLSVGDEGVRLEF